MHVYGKCTGHISCYPYTRTYPPIAPPIYCTCDWILLIVTSERDNQNCRYGARITKEGGSLKRDLRAGSVCLSICLSVCMYVCSSRSVL